MIKAHIYLDGKMYSVRRLEHCFHKGDTVRLAGAVYGVVTEVIWCLDEAWPEGQRVNVRLESEPQV